MTDDVLQHYGMPRRSGRYPWGSGKDPYQGSEDFIGRVEKLTGFQGSSNNKFVNDSGTVEDLYKHDFDLVAQVEALRKSKYVYTDPNTGKKYVGETAIAKKLNMSTTEYRKEIGIASANRKAIGVERAQSMFGDGYTKTEIARQLGVSEGTVRNWLAEAKTIRKHKSYRETADFLKKVSSQYKDGGMLDVGKGVEHSLNISREKLDKALKLLQDEGWHVYTGGIKNVTNPSVQTNQKVLCPPDTEYKEIYDFERVHSVRNYVSHDNGHSYDPKYTYPASMDPKRLQVVYAKNGKGGVERDGLIELRPGCADLSLGNSVFSQVRILVDGTHYLKGMACYGDPKDFPPGVDVRFHTNKTEDVPALGAKNHTVLKNIGSDPDNPFGSTIKDADQGGQYWYTDSKGKKQLGLINKRSDEGDWSEWSNGLPAQFLSKQNWSLTKQQLNKAKAEQKAEFDQIMALDNPTIKKHLLTKFAQTCDSKAVDLKAAALPGQRYHVIMPAPSLKDNQVYAPDYPEGSKIALIRYPHAGLFEIPVLTVTHHNKESERMIGKDAQDAICINAKNASQLSGADFDGDTVMCIPTDDPAGKVHISRRPPIPGLADFDPTDAYGPATYEGRQVPLLTKQSMQNQMGIISNLITDMTLFGANDEEMARAVKHSMVVIDAYKHKLDYKKSERDNHIAELHEKYQGKAGGGASTIVSRASSQYHVDKREGQPKVNIKGTAWYDPNRPEGSLIYKTASPKKLYYQKKVVNKRTGEVTYKQVKRTDKITKMEHYDDPYELVSPLRHKTELLYADYASYMKAMANQARIAEYNTSPLKYNPEARVKYRAEYESLKYKLAVASTNKPRERMAQRMANVELANKKAQGVFDDHDKSYIDDYTGEVKYKIDQKAYKKASQQAITKARAEVESLTRAERNIKITDKEWEAIQAGAISNEFLKNILANADITELRERATPRPKRSISAAQSNRMQAMYNNGMSIAEIARQMHVSTSTVEEYLNKNKKE